MKNGKCPQCGSTTVHSIRSGLGFGNSSSIYIYFDGRGKPSPTMAYVCVSCGYIEVYLTEKSYLAEVAQKWPKVTPRES